jgi:hypothetical protein
MEWATSGVGNTIKWMFIIIPVVFLGVAFFFALRYKLDCKRFDCVVGGVNRLKSGQRMADFSEEEQQEFELLTGKPVHKLWAVKGDTQSAGGPDEPPVGLS